MYRNYFDFLQCCNQKKTLCTIVHLNNHSRAWNTKYQIFLACTWTPVSSELRESLKKTNGFILQATSCFWNKIHINLILRNISATKKKVTDQYFYLRKCQILLLDAKPPAKTEAVLLSKWTVSCELSAPTTRGLATSDFFFSGGVRWVWSWSSCSGTHSLCSRTGGWLWEAPTRPRMSHLLWLGDQARCINDWYEERRNFGGQDEKEAGCIHPIEVPPGWKLREAIVMIPASSWVSFRLNCLFSDTHDCRWFSNRLNWLASLL